VTATLSERTAPDRTADTGIAPDEPQRPVPEALTGWRDPRPWVGWLVVVGLTILSGFTRFWGLGFPNQKIFDEAYYPVEAQEILRYGYEDNRGYLFIVHPPLGKWLIGWSSDLFGNGLHSAFGWRVFPAVFGCLTVIVVARIARRMTRSNLFGALAGLFIALDGLSLVLARTAILDVFLEFFVIAAFGALVLDRDQLRGRLGRLLADGADLSHGVPSLGPRPWRLLAGVLFGLACAVKWTALSFFVLFVVLSLLWDRGALKAAGASRPTRSAGRRSALPAIGSLLAVPIGTYLFTYLGWFVGENGWGRHYADNHSASTTLHLLGLNVPWTWAWVPAPIRALGAQTLNAYRFHEGLDSGHAYMSNPWNWLILGRPVDFYYSGDGTACGASSCSREVLLIGTPLLWWAFLPMLLWLAWHYVTTRDWRAAAVWVAFAAGWLVWFQDLKRTMFLFYMAPLLPFLVLGLTLALGTMLGPAPRRSGDVQRDERALRRRRWGIAGLATYLALVIADFVWMWPIFTGGLLTYDTWHAHMWLPSWV
jgi:dolichyl-phosphate-mannose--protein O-mannosyl transferase